jgi:hypothetical protein
MATPKLKISEDFSLPLDVAGEAIGILATRGAGKSFTAAVLVEEMYDAGIQVIVLDPTGVWWGLRGSGRGDGLPIYVFGGQHGDLPLEATAGDLIADLAVDEPHSFVLDLSGFDTKSAQTRFVRSFAERLYRRKAQNRATIHLVIDEADEFAPQRTLSKDEPAMLGAMESIVRRGRSRGLGVTMISQRSAALNKNVLALAETLIVMRTPAPQDRKAVEEWISHHHLADKLNVLDSMPGLRTGTAWIWSPVRDILKQVEIRHIRTFDSYRTPKPGETPIQPRKIAEIDLDELGKRMAATVERAKATNPVVLQRRIAELEKELRTRPTEQLVEHKTVEVPVLGPSDIAELETVVAQMREIASEITEPIIVKADELMLALHERKMTDAHIRRDAASLSGTKKPAAASVGAAEKPKLKREPGPSANGFDPTNAQQKVLDAIAWLEDTGLEADRLRIGWLCGYTQSGHFNNLLSSLKTVGAITYPTPGLVALTEMGATLSQPPAPALSQEAIQERALSILMPAQQRVLRVVMRSYPDDISRADVASQLEYSESGHFNNLISKLTTLGMITRSRGGYVRAADLLFMQGASAGAARISA